jgi:hypothetical protein
MICKIIKYGSGIIIISGIIFASIIEYELYKENKKKEKHFTEKLDEKF